MPTSWWNAWESCLLALTIWREASGESYEGRVAVAHAVLNRVAHPSWWGTNLTDVLVKRWQFSSLTAPNDPMLVRWPRYGDPVFDECLEIANGVLTGEIDNPVPEADSYWSDTLSEPPFWATDKTIVAKIGHHTFHNLDGSHPENVPDTA